ncbi:MAG: hypothetical protein R3204_16890, partial [Oceanospirillum sp.]|nr:hypothetical protein [Oceanospirillum sp.]
SELNLALTADTGLSVTGTMAGTLSDVGSVAGDILLLKNAAGEYSFDASRLELPVLGELVGDLSFDLNPQTDAQNTVTSLFADEVVLSGNGIGMSVPTAYGSAVISDASLALLLKDDPASTDPLWALSATADLAISGIPGMELSGEQIGFVYNATGQSVDHTATFTDGSQLQMQATAEQVMQLNGALTVDVEGVGQLAGELHFAQDQQTLTLSDNTVITTDRFVISGEDTALEIDAINGGDFSLQGANFIYGQVINQADAAQSWNALTLEADAVSLTGLPDLSLSGTNFSLATSQSDQTTAVNWAEQSLSLDTDSGSLSLDLTADQLGAFSASGALTLAMADSAQITGE